MLYQALRLLIATLIFLGVPFYAWADSSNLPSKGNVVNNKYPVCLDIQKILLIPNNRKYISSGQYFDFSQLIIPERIKSLKAVEWKDVTEAELKNKLSVEHKKLTKYLSHQNPALNKIDIIHKADVDVYNRGKSNELYRVEYHKGRRNYLFEPDDVRRGFKKIFDDNASEADPFIYKNEVFFGEKRGGGFSCYPI